MNIMTIGIIFLVIGVALLPFGIMYFKETWDEYREQELSLLRKITIVILEVIAMFTLTAGLSTWILSISLIFIIFGTAVIYFVSTGAI
ncbi:MAG: hypothetical protein R3328_04665 [Planococcaceae bacterium]|nr:hypothetical protein [Planococcaceae bacterium]